MKKPSNKLIIMGLAFLLILSLIVGPGSSAFSSSVATDNLNKNLPMKEVVISMKGVNHSPLTLHLEVGAS